MKNKTATVPHDTLSEVCYLTVICVFISFVGWCFEKAGRYLVYHDTADRGFLTLPLCPIYGVSIVAIFLLCGTPTHIRGIIGSNIRRTRLWQRTVKDKPLRKYIFYFLFVTLVPTLAELVVGLTAKAFGVTLWDYSDRAFNLFGVICLSFSLIWGALITAFMAFLWKPLYRLIHRIPVYVARRAAFTLSLAISVDFLVTLILL